MDKICIEELKIFAYHGVFPEENRKGQNFFVNAVLFVDTEKAGLTDDLECSVDYSQVCRVIEEVMTGNVFKLIETAAQRVAEEILRRFPLVEKLEVEIRKPEAPIAMEFGSVSVRAERGWHDVLVAVGSNMGDSRSIIEKGITALEQSPYNKELRRSELIVTKPYGYTEQDDFLNGAVRFRTMLSPHGLLDLLHDIENSAGRKREIHWGPRTLDLDIIFYDRDIIDDEDLIIPHADMHNRSFVLTPAAELMPGYRHPVLGMTVAELKRRLEQ